MDNKELVEKLKSFYEEFSTDQLDDLDSIYHDDVAFNDPIHQVVGRDDLRNYFEHTMENVEYCHFTFEYEVIGDKQAYLSWQMRFSHPKLANGREIILPGVSHVQFEDEKIRLQEDHYDLGAMLYEHVPLVGFVIDKIKQRLVSS